MEKKIILNELNKIQKERQNEWKLADLKKGSFIKQEHTNRYATILAAITILQVLTEQEYKDLLHRAREQYMQAQTKQTTLNL